jgi:hypothetical protein
MPIWRFKVGDFTSPIEAATGMRPKIVTPGGIVERPAHAGAIARWRARRQVKAIRKSVEAANRIQVRWTDEGGVAYCQQSRGFEPLRAYAKWLDCRNRFPHFGPAPDGNYYKHPAFLAQVDDLSCPHLVEHSCYSGYFLPCEFERLVKVEPFLIYGHWPSAHSVGSSPRLLRELERVQEELQVSSDYQYPQEDPLIAVKTAFLQLREVAQLSCQHGLPIIFWG